MSVWVINFTHSFLFDVIDNAGLNFIIGLGKGVLNQLVILI